MTRIILVRHGETIWNVARRFQGQTDIELNDLGRRQAMMVGRHLASERIDAAYSSDLVRSMETARLILQGRDLDIVPRPDLREFNFGEWEGLSAEQIRAQDPDALDKLRNHGLRPRGGETWVEMCARVIGAFEDIKNRHDGGTVLVVAHVNPLRVILEEALGMEHNGMLRMPVRNCAISILETDGTRCNLVVLNDQCHLEKAPEEVRAS